MHSLLSSSVPLSLMIFEQASGNSMSPSMGFNISGFGKVSTELTYIYNRSSPSSSSFSKVGTSSLPGLFCPTKDFMLAQESQMMLELVLADASSLG